MNLGEMNTLRVDEFTDHGAYLTDQAGQRVLFPGKFIPQSLKEGDEIEVFLYNDSEDRPVATTQTPLVKINEIAYLEVVSVSKHGAFLDWGLDKDLFVPYKNMREEMEEGSSYFVSLYLDEMSGRLTGTERFGYLFEQIPDIRMEEPIEAMVYDVTDLGYKIYAEGPSRGLMFRNEVFQQLEIGQKITVYLKNVRPDGKFDFKLERGDAGSVDNCANKIVAYAQSNKGVCNVTDSSSSDEIAKQFGVSKKLFKKAVGLLYRSHQITLEPGKLVLIGDKPSDNTERRRDPKRR
jgi:uncharacterized protein